MKPVTKHCAVYTRKSTDERLEMEFNSLDAQRESCLAYITSQKAEGWQPVKKSYDDGGFSGGSMDRPALAELLADIKAGKVHIVVVYKIDRLTRSLMDFSKLVEAFDLHGVTFVSVTQSFNTTTSMGRLTLNVLLSFAQFEREVAGERIRDKIAASKKKGMFMGGVPPIGYRVEKRQLVIDSKNAKITKHIFERYLALNSTIAVANELKAQGIKSPTRISEAGIKYEGAIFSRGAIQQILINPLYIGKVKHKDALYDGQHQGIIPAKMWHEVQDKLQSNAATARGTKKATDSGGDRPWTGTYAVKSGAQYEIRKVSVVPARYKSFLKMALAGQPLEAVHVLAAQEKLQSAIAKDRCYFNLAVDNQVMLDAKNKKADILFRVTAGPQAKMGQTVFEGNDKVKTSYLQKMVNWKEGDCFTREKIDALRAALFESGLFSGADVVIPEKPLKDGRVPVTLRVKERAFRSISAGISYYTDEGPGLTLGWKHRNLFGAAESLETSLKLSQRNQNIESRLTKPFFLRRDQSISFNASMGHEDTDAYLKTGFDTGVAVKRVFTKRLSGSTGVSLSLNEIRDKTLLDTSTFYLLSFPQGLTYDSRDNALDAHRGFLLDGRIEPFVDVAGESSPFGKAEMTGQAYHALGSKTVAAMRMKVGSIIGPATLDIPATKRFYAGGGGSVRGFGYQEIGPQKNGEPEGGRSLVEASGELRYKVTDTIGVVAFVDAGSVGASPVADFNHLSVGGGGGLRYYTDFGPLRMDVGVPLTHKNTASAAYQLYISIGQTF